MKFSCFGFLLACPLALSQVTTYTYQSGPVYSVETSPYPDQNTGLWGTPLQGLITLANPLPQNGTEEVNPLSAQFTNLDWPSYPVDGTFIFTTLNGQIVSFSVFDHSPQGVGGGATLFSASSTDGAQLENYDENGGYIAFADSGGWIDPPSATAVPEISADHWPSSITLLLESVTMSEQTGRFGGSVTSNPPPTAETSYNITGFQLINELYNCLRNVLHNAPTGGDQRFQATITDGNRLLSKAEGWMSSQTNVGPTGQQATGTTGRSSQA
jgi:hypothetical protein